MKASLVIPWGSGNPSQSCAVTKSGCPLPAGMTIAFDLRERIYRNGALSFREDLKTIPPMRSNRARTIALTAVAMLAFAANSILCRLALTETGIDPASFTTVRIAAGAAPSATLAE
jgi:hypothetical protein